MIKKAYLLITIMAMLAVFSGCKDSTTEPEPEDGTEFEVILEAVDYSLSSMSATYNSSVLDSLITAGTPPQVLSVRAASIFEIGHIPGALNTDWSQKAIFLPDYLRYGGAFALMAGLIILWYVFVKWNERTGKFSAI